MERLTKPGYRFSLLNVIQGLNRYAEIDEIMNRLAGYEDTGLTPEEVAKLARSEGCEYCRERKPILDDAGQLQIDDSDGSIWYTAQVAADDIYGDHTNIRFCPMCGRKLNN